ncbi:MAG: endo alpha-1,4 polygalactosaminidase [Deltaproteobacteria bacterium]|nr:endo alpha-1,4 polygalactosaminidase [Deltaproteobacteria bacterium]
MGQVKGLFFSPTSIFLLGLLLCFSYLVYWQITPRPLRWIVFYGDDFSGVNWRTIDLAIVDPSHFTPSEISSSRTKFFAYLSIGEAEEYRDYWPLVRDQPFLIEKNPEWPGSHRVDIRSADWQNLLLTQLIPSFVRQGYHGLFLDTVDTASYLESLNPEKFSGSREALVQWIRTVHRQFPDLLLIPNNGLEFLKQYGDVIYGVGVEDLYTRHDFRENKNYPTPPEIRDGKERLLDQFRGRYHKAIFNILYEDSRDSPLAREAIRRSRKKGYLWYLTTVDLNKIGVLN